MTNWRDIADQLTPAQIDLLEWLEGDPLNGLLAKPGQHLAFARGWASENLEQCLHADISAPANAVEVGPWRKSTTGVRGRAYLSSVSGLAGLDITLEIRGTQYADGHIECCMGLSGAGLGELSPSAARDLAAALAEAADAVEGK